MAEVKYSINCSIRPFVPKDYTLGSHSKNGRIEFSPAMVRLYVSSLQLKGANKLQKEIMYEPGVSLNANVLDFLLRRPDVIPENWKKDADGNVRCILFRGTIFLKKMRYVRYGKNYYIQHIRFLVFRSGKWDWGLLPMIDK